MIKNRHGGNIEIHINELILRGLPRNERHRIGAAIIQELHRQLSERGLPDTLTRNGDIPRLYAGPIQAVQDAGPERVGMQVAQAVYACVAGGRRPATRPQVSASPPHIQENKGGSFRS